MFQGGIYNERLCASPWTRTRCQPNPRRQPDEKVPPVPRNVQGWGAQEIHHQQVQRGQFQILRKQLTLSLHPSILNDGSLLLSDRYSLQASSSSGPLHPHRHRLYLFLEKGKSKWFGAFAAVVVVFGVCRCETFQWKTRQISENRQFKFWNVA